MNIEPKPSEHIEAWIKLKTPITVFLINGVKLQGRLAARDLVGFTLERNENVQVIYHTAVSTIMPQSNLTPRLASA